MKKVFLLILVLAFAASSGFAQVPAKPFNIYAGAGLTMPMSPDNLKDGTKLGFHGTAKLGFNTFPKGEFVIGLDYHYLPADLGMFEDEGITDADGGDMSVIMAGGDLKLNLGIPMTGLNPFVHGGIGMAIISFSDLSWTQPGVGERLVTTDSENKFYFQIGGGLEFNKFFVDVRYINILKATYDDVGDETSASIIPITVGVKF